MDALQVWSLLVTAGEMLGGGHMLSGYFRTLLLHLSLAGIHHVCFWLHSQASIH